MIIGYFYGLEMELTRDWSIEKLLLSIRSLGVSLLENQIFGDIRDNFDDYGFFLLLSIAHKFNVKWLKEKCEEELILMNFEQLNYNRYDLFQVNQETLEEILKLHEILKVNENFQGLRHVELVRIIE
jgi:hypothetical protein